MRLTVQKTKKIDVPNDPDLGYINIKLLDLDQIASIEAKCNKTGLSQSSDVMVELDPFKREDKIAMTCLTGWGNMFDVKGKAMKFNRKNINEARAFVITVDDTKVRFLEWVDQQHSIFFEEDQDETKVASEN